MKHDAAQWPGRDLRHQQLRGASLCGANLIGCRLEDVDLRGADLWGANLALCSLRRADLRGARLSCASFAGADLRAARLAGAELTFCDLGGAHLACADFGRPRKHRVHVEARRLGFPSFADALCGSYPEASWMKSGPVLLAIDAALDVSADPVREFQALLNDGSAQALAVAAMTIARRSGIAATRSSSLLSLLGLDHLGAAIAVALLESGTAAETILERCPELGTRDGPAYRERVVWHDLVARRLRHVEAWPREQEQPPPLPAW